MVVLHVKAAPPASVSSSSSRSQDGDEETEFLYECAASAAVADVAAALGALAGLQAAVLSLCRRIRARCAGAGHAATGELERALDEAEAYASKEQVQRNRFLSPRALREHIKNIKKKCATALQEPPEALSLQELSSDSKHERIQIWWAGKELAMDQKLSDYIGVNDKTKPQLFRLASLHKLRGAYTVNINTIMQITLKRLFPFEGDDAESDSKSETQVTSADISLILSGAVSSFFFLMKRS